METTVILLKPDCVQQRLIGEVIRRFEALDLRLRGCKMVKVSRKLLEEHYAHLAERPFFPEIVAFMQSSPIVALALEGPDCIEAVRRLLGPTDSTAAPPETIRGRHGTDQMKNIAHASDSPETAAAELSRFFDETELF